MRRGGVLLTLWLVVAGMAIATGTWALSLVGGEINNQTVEPLSNAAINRNLQADRADQADQAGDGLVTVPEVTGPTNAPGAVTYNLTTPGGGIVANCQGNLAYLVQWSPAPGYRADFSDEDTVRGPAPVARLKFEADKSSAVAEIIASVRCPGGVPKVTVTTDDDHHGGGTANTPTPTPTTHLPSAPTVTDDNGSGGHGADDGAGDDHHRRGGGSGGGGG